MAATQRRHKRDTKSLQHRVREERKSVYLQAINEAAERVFAAKGTDRSNMREIATEAGISLGTLYAVIDGKDALVFGIHSDRMREFLDCIRDARDRHEDTLASHLAVLREGALYFLDHPDFLRMCCRAGFGWASGAAAAKGENPIWSEGSAIPRDLFARGVADGIYVDDDPDLMVRKMLALKQADLTYWVDGGMKTPNEAVLDRIEAQFIRAFCVKQAS